MTLADAVRLVIVEFERDPDVSLVAAVQRALPFSAAAPALAGPPDGRDWWHGVVEDHVAPYLESGMSYDAELDALRDALEAVV